MKVYVYGEYVQGINKNRVRKYEDITTSLGEAFLFCYEVGLDGNDYFLIEYDLESLRRNPIFITDAKYDHLFRSVQNRIQNRLRMYHSQIPALHPEDV